MVYHAVDHYGYVMWNFKKEKKKKKEKEYFNNIKTKGQSYLHQSHSPHQSGVGKGPP